MALPSAVTVGSLVLVAVAGVGLVAVSSSANDAPSDERGDQAKQQPRTPTPSAHTGGGDREKSGRADTPDRQDRTKRERPQPTRPEVEIFNSTGVSGLAADLAAELQTEGWRVPVTDNWYGDIPADTVYFQPGAQRAARDLARELGMTRIRPADTPMSDERLTVILTEV